MTGICTETYISESTASRKSPPAGNKVHYVYILLKIRSKFILFLLALLPLLSEKGSLSVQLLSSLLLQFIALSIVLIPAVISRHYLRWAHDGKFITLSSGFISKKSAALPICNIRSVSVIKTPMLSLFKAVRLEIRSSNGRKKPEITLFLSRDEADTLTVSLMPLKKARQTLIPRTLPFILSAASQANFAAGLLILSVFISSLGITAAELFSDRLNNVSRTAALLIPYLHPAVSILSGIVLLGWVIHFLNICFSDARQITSVSDEYIIIVRGLISTRLTCLRRGSVSSLISRRTALTSLFGQCTINLSVTGQDRKKDICALSAWPCSDKANVFSDLCSISKSCDISVRVPDNARLIWWLPYGCITLLMMLLFVKSFISEGMELSVFSYVLLFFSGLSLWKCIIGIIGSGKGRIKLSGQSILISSVRKFSLLEQNILMGHIAEFRITSTLIQKHRHLCTVAIRAVGSNHVIKCRNLPFETVSNLSERIM